MVPRDGAIRQAWFTDLDGDGAPEVAVWCRSTGPDASGRLTLVCINEDDRSLSVEEVPELPSSWARGYRGHDVYRVEQGTIYRTFPVYRSRDTDDAATGGERTLKLIYERERWMWRLHAQK